MTQLDRIPTSAAGGVVLAGTAFARINWGRLIVDCPRPGCTSALMVPPWFAGIECWDCGWSAPVHWPSNLADIVAVLLMRPDPKTRNWEPGESVMELVAENLAHGIAPTRDELAIAQSNGPLVREAGDRIVAGTPLLIGDIPAAEDRLAQLASIPPARVDRLSLEG